MHTFDTEVYYEDTDMGGIVYHANFLKFIERGRSAFVRDLGMDQVALRAAGIVFVVHRIEAQFLAPARLQDLLQVRTDVAEASGARLSLCQSVWRDDAEVFRARVDLAAMTLAGRPTRLPADLRIALSDHIATVQ